ncbi:AAA family ATPase [Comamonas sp. JC664]|uniref:tyrosine-protein kinase family protein n=1 Tax=Comamonas sp. JC664 TaxID=2801917 RepID=UPI00174C1C8C|nr:AAA family ATPase [Comamonas sp. JC664]MBL0696520.1 AAA family ATPase [Comamonas sp. JC664]
MQDGPVRPPWPLHSKSPAIVSFYSFKGGVGRTTSLGIVARQFARQGHHVVVIDLDLEAPGLGRFFDVRTDRGVLDILSTHAATGIIDLEGPEVYSQTHDEGDGKVTVYPVGLMDWSYVERLACLDYAPRANAEPSAVEKALRELLNYVKRKNRPDYIFLDARAGLHDLGGLSLHALAHVDVLVGRAGVATRDGFQLVLEALARRREDENLRVVVVQTFAPLPVSGEDYARVRDAWSLSLHEIFAPTIYERIYTRRGDDLPEVNGKSAMHWPWVIPQYESVGRVDRIQDIDNAILDSEPYADLCARIVERCGRSLIAGSVDADEEVDDGSEITE